jgi:thioredoxin-like negative regulator of GroEL
MNCKKRYFVLPFIIILLAFSCKNTSKLNTENDASENTATDDYAILRAPNTPQRIAEDFSGKVIILTEKDFIERITAIDNPKGFQYLGQTPCIVEFYAAWCKPCGYQSELLSMVAPEYQGRVIFYKLNIDRAYQLSQAFDVKDIPMLLFFKPRGSITIHVGYKNREKLTKLIDDLLL